MASVIVWITARCGSPKERRSVLIVTVDTLRADHVGCYGYPRPTTPNVDRLAAEGVRFEQVTTPRGKTQPSMVSMLTGLYPHEHGIRINFGLLPPVRLAIDPGGPLRPSASTPVLLAEELSAAGLTTGAFVGNYVLDAERTGLGRGFDTYDDEMTSTELGRAEAPERKARDNTDRAIRWLKQNSDEPFFLWVHYIDPHGTYEPPAEYDTFEGAPLGRVPLGAMRRESPVDEDGWRILVPPHNIVLDPETGKRQLELARYIDLYDGEIAYTDAELGRLLAVLDELGRTEDTLVIFTADHGESLGEHEVYFEHGYYTYDVSVRIPLVLRPPANDARFAALERGLVVREPADLLDLRPTILEWLDVPRSTHPSGRSLLGILTGIESGDPGRVTFTERSEFGSLIRAARTPDWKLIYNLASPADWPLRYPRELYDLKADPLEAHNLYESDDPRATGARTLLEAELTTWIQGAGDLRTFVGEDLEAISNLPPEHLARMKAMGYVDSRTAQNAEDANAAREFHERALPEDQDPREVLEWALAGASDLGALALEGLARYGDLPAERLILYLDPGHALSVRARAAELTGELGVASAIDSLRRTHAHSDPADAGLRAASAYALELLGEPIAFDKEADELTVATRHASSGVRGLAAWYLGRLGRVEPVEPLTRDTSAVVRAFAWQALAGADRSGWDEALAREAAGDQPLDVQAAALVLASLRPPEENRALVQSLRAHAHPWIANVGQELAVWSSAGEALAALRAREQLAPTERRRLVNAAAIVAGIHARPELERALADADPDVRVIAAVHCLRLDQ